MSTRVLSSLCTRTAPLGATAMLILAGAMPAMAQDSSPTAALPPIQQQMSAAEFKDAGLDKLSQDELVRLNTWLNRAIGVQTEKAAAQAEQRMKDVNRGFFNFGSSEPILSAIQGEFRGFGRGRHYILANGQEWQQVDEATLSGVRKTNPKVRISPSVVGNAWYMKIDGYATNAKVQRVK